RVRVGVRGADRDGTRALAPLRGPRPLGVPGGDPAGAPDGPSPQDVGVTLLDPALSAIFLGFVLGLQHATDPDHLVAVATILTRERRFASGALIGVLWGAGHMTTLTIVGAIIIGLKLTITPAVGGGLELVVAAMLIVLGVLRLRDAVRAPETVPAGHLVADHDHGGGVGVVHSHPHVHDAEHAHEHPHIHPSRWPATL